MRRGRVGSSLAQSHAVVSACKTLIRLNIFPLVSCSLMNELPARPPAHANLPGALRGYSPPSTAHYY